MSNGKTQEELLAQIEALKSQNQELKEKNIKAATLSCRVSQKGAVSVYGLGRFPVTLYGEQWGRLIEFVPTVKQFIEDNRDKLSVKE